MIKYGDGEKTVQSYKHLMLWCKNLGLGHYSKGLLETQYQAVELPAPQRTSLIWNRYVNNWGRADSRVPKDLDLEHKNFTLKQELKSYRGDYTQKSLDKISKAGNIRREICDNFAKATGHYVSKSVKEMSTADIKILVNALRSESLYENIPGRTYRFVHVPRNLLQCDKAAVMQWADIETKYRQTKHYYRYLNAE